MTDFFETVMKSLKFISILTYILKELNLFYAMVSFYTILKQQNTRNFLCIQRVQKENSGMKWVYCYLKHLQNISHRFTDT